VLQHIQRGDLGENRRTDHREIGSAGILITLSLRKIEGATEEKPRGPAQKKPARGRYHCRLRDGTLAALFVEILHSGIDGGRRAR